MNSTDLIRYFPIYSKYEFEKYGVEVLTSSYEMLSGRYSDIVTKFEFLTQNL